MLGSRRARALSAAFDIIAADAASADDDEQRNERALARCALMFSRSFVRAGDALNFNIAYVKLCLHGGGGESVCVWGGG